MARGIDSTASISLAGNPLLHSIAKIERGGYGTVYRGLKEDTDESYAIKEMFIDEIFEREVKAMSSIPEHVYPH